MWNIVMMIVSLGIKCGYLTLNISNNNDFLAVNQFTIIENDYNRRPDIILFINGLPIVVIELKNPADEKATLKKGYQQLQTYQTQISSLFHFNEILIISDGTGGRAGTLTSNYGTIYAMEDYRW